MLIQYTQNVVRTNRPAATSQRRIWPIYLITVYTVVINTDLSDCNKHIRLHAHRPFKVGGYFPDAESISKIK